MGGFIKYTADEGSRQSRHIQGELRGPRFILIVLCAQNVVVVMGGGFCAGLFLALSSFQTASKDSGKLSVLATI